MRVCVCVCVCVYATHSSVCTHEHERVTLPELWVSLSASVSCVVFGSRSGPLWVSQTLHSLLYCSASLAPGSPGGPESGATERKHSWFPSTFHTSSMGGKGGRALLFTKLDKHTYYVSHRNVCVGMCVCVCVCVCVYGAE